MIFIYPQEIMQCLADFKWSITRIAVPAFRPAVPSPSRDSGGGLHLANLPSRSSTVALLLGKLPNVGWGWIIRLLTCIFVAAKIYA